MKKLLYVCLLLFPFSLLAEGGGDNSIKKLAVISGGVYDAETAEALSGAEIKIEGTDYKAYSNFDGNFELNNIVPGKYTIHVSFVSYALTRVYHIDIQKSGFYNIDFRLTQN